MPNVSFRLFLTKNQIVVQNLLFIVTLTQQCCSYILPKQSEYLKLTE